jgi:hypothetical protein
MAFRHVVRCGKNHATSGDLTFRGPSRRGRSSIRRVKERSTFVLLLAGALGCGVQDEATSLERDVPFACSVDGDCPAGSCLAEFGICTRPRGEFEKLLFEVTPQASDPVYGGARFLTYLDVSSPPSAGSRLDLNVKARIPVTGRVAAAPEQRACLAPARSTLPVTLTFTPREQLLALSLPSYEITTVFDDDPKVREYVFTGSIPPGHYDVYMRPDFERLSPDCRATPQIFRDRSIGLMEGGDRLELEQPPPFALKLTITWTDMLEGWQLDMIHPVTGELISNVVVLHASEVDTTTNQLVTTLTYSHADDDFILPAGELVRLTPPSGVTAGTVLLSRSGIEIVTPGEAEIGSVPTFGTPVAFQAWVWKRGEADAPAPGTVSFSAIELDAVENNRVPTSFEASARVDETGQVNASLLPGRYRVRITPPGLEMIDRSLMTSYESTVTVWPNDESALDQQGGHVIDVPAARSLTGRVIAETNGAALRRVDIRASAAHTQPNLCPSDGTDLPESCEGPLGPVLQRALALDPFIPRTRNALSDDDGRFTVEGLDCGRCEPGVSTYFDLTVRPDVATGLPWVVRSSVDPVADAAELTANPVRIPMPVARPMQVTYDDPINTGAGTEDPADDEMVIRRLSGALVRVFAILDGQGQLVTQPEGLVPCISLPNPGDTPCLESLLQVAEARTEGDGDFLLLLPPDVE